jgi:hypothetical protein
MTVLSQRSFAQTFSATLKFYRSDCGRRFEFHRKTSLTIDRRLFTSPCFWGQGQERNHSHFFSLNIQ